MDANVSDNLARLIEAWYYILWGKNNHEEVLSALNQMGVRVIYVLIDEKQNRTQIHCNPLSLWSETQKALVYVRNMYNQWQIIK